MSVAFEPEPFEHRRPALVELAQALLQQVELLEEIQLEQQVLQ